MMTQRIIPGERIDGRPMTQIRAYLRSVVGCTTSWRSVARRFDLSEDGARRLLRALVREGYMERAPVDPRDTEPYWHVTHRGQQLAAATAAAPLTRPTADRLLHDVVQRMGEVNAGPFAFRVHRAYVFGSYLDRARERINDVDVVLTLAPRFPDGDAQFAYAQQRIAIAQTAGRQFSNLSMLMFWPEHEILLALRRRSRGLSLMLLERGDDGRLPIAFGNRHQQIFPVAFGGEHPLHRGTNDGLELCLCAGEAFQFGRGQ
jgi:hypothetical protein